VVHWVIVGGESGPNHRHCNVNWIRDVLRQCRQAGVPAFVKQLGSDPRYDVNGTSADGQSIEILNAPLPKRLSHKGGNMEEWPSVGCADLCVREFPNL